MSLPSKSLSPVVFRRTYFSRAGFRTRFHTSMPVADDKCVELNEPVLLKRPVFDPVFLHLRKRRTVDGRLADGQRVPGP
jgi:hypothetical protein